jgi:hypothetical protein
MATTHGAGAGVAGAVTGIGLGFAALIAQIASPHQHLARNGGFVLSVAIALVSALILATILLHWAYSA